MKINDIHYKSLWEEIENNQIIIKAIDQRLLPFRFEIATIRTSNEMIDAIKDMLVRGAPLIGIAGAYGIVLALQEVINNKVKTQDEFFEVVNNIKTARPTAINLSWAVDKIMRCIDSFGKITDVYNKAIEIARKIYNDEISACEKIAKNGYELIRDLYQAKQRPINILTHCNAGWLATVDWGTALAPIFYANRQGIPLHIWVDETRPRNQGTRLTAFELLGENIPHTIITDNAGGLLMQTGKVDAVIVGADRVTKKGDVCNKIGTYLKALAAKNHNIPFWVAFPTSTIDRNIDNYLEVPIEIRSEDEINYIEGIDEHGNIRKIRVTPLNAHCLNYSFDITPADFITSYITEKGAFKNILEII